ncbi:MAG: peptide ABC transporter substrate-binding protein [Opitutaceae bacterium]|nr:peptide ABC transporter substrate-binding protein [Opitutaceae bacterium]
MRVWIFHRLFFGVILGLFAAMQSGCWSRENAVDRGSRAQVLHRGLGADVADLDPHVITGLPEINVVSALFEGLVAEDPVDLSPVPGVAERWEVSADGLTYTFRLRADARWSNGDPVTAADFVASFRRVLTPALAADYASMLHVIEGAQAYHRGASGDFGEVGVHAPDARTLVIRLEHPTPHFLSLLTHPVWYPVHLPTLERSGDSARRGGTWTRPGQLVGNGAFTLREWRPGKVIVVEKSPGYWDAAAVRLNAIHFHVTDSVEAEERMFRAGQLHITEALPVGKVETYRRARDGALHISPFLDTYFYRLNVTRPFLNDRRVRRALALAIDRDAIVEKITRGGQQPAYSFTPPGTAGYRPPADFQGGADAARALLAEAGYPGGRGLPAFELLISSSGNHRVIAEAVQEMWRRELGVTVNLLNMEHRTLLAQRRALDYQILRSDWIGDYLDPNSFLEIFTGASGNNHTGWRHPGYDALIYEAARTADPARRHDVLRRAEALLLDEAPIIPVYHYTTVRLVHPAVRGWHATLLDRHPYKHVWLEP